VIGPRSGTNLVPPPPSHASLTGISSPARSTATFVASFESSRLSRLCPFAASPLLGSPNGAHSHPQLARPPTRRLLCARSDAVGQRVRAGGLLPAAMCAGQAVVCQISGARCRVRSFSRTAPRNARTQLTFKCWDGEQRSNNIQQNALRFSRFIPCRQPSPGHVFSS
jgi:hypothetical protein